MKPLRRVDRCPQYQKSFNEKDLVEPAAPCYWEVDISEASCVVYPNKDISNSEIQLNIEKAALLVAFSKVSDIRE